MLTNINKIAFFVFFVCVIHSCSLTKYVPQDESLLNRNRVKNTPKGLDKSVLEKSIVQKPNSKMLGFMRTRLALYSLSGRDSSKSINRFLRKVGEAPVLFDSTVLDNSNFILKEILKNNGFLDATVGSEYFTKRKKTTVTYNILGKQRYKIRYLYFDIPHDSIMNFLNTRNVINALEGENFSIDKLNSVREGIAQSLRRRGYYGVQKEHFSFLADTISLMHNVDLKLTLSSELKDSGDINRLFSVKKIDNITIYCIDESSISDIGDTVFIDQYKIIYNSKKHFFSPKFICSKILLAKNQVYSERLVEYTTANFQRLSAVKNVGINFLEKSPSLIDIHIYIYSSDKYNYSVSIEGTTNTGSSIGAGVNLAFEDKSFFRGGEVFRLGTFASYDAYKREDSKLSHSYSLGGDASLSFPRLLLPFVGKETRQRTSASTQFSVNYNFQNNTPKFVRSIANTTMTYKWQGRSNSYQLDAIDLSYIRVPLIDAEFVDRNKFLRHSFENHIILKTMLTYSTTNRRRSNPLQNHYAFRGSIASGGNLFYAISKATKQEKRNDKYEIFKTPYSQFIKANLDYSLYISLNEKSGLVYHINFGAGLPYGNSNILPFEERFFAGGSNSMRAWGTRALGPGKFHDPSGDYFLTQNGDIKLEMNVEARFKMFWVVEGAAFVDAGNIWTIKSYPDQEGGEFVLKNGEFLKQIAVGYGVGLRFDFSFFLIRFDFGFKLHDPKYQDEYQRWRTKSFNFKNDFAFQFAIGYPF